MWHCSWHFICINFVGIVTLSLQEYCYPQYFKGICFFLCFGLKNNYLATVWAFDVNIFSCRFFNCVISDKDNYLVPARIVIINILKAQFFLHFWLKDNYLLLRRDFGHKYFQHHILLYVAIKFPLKKRVRLWCNSANFWSKHDIFLVA